MRAVPGELALFAEVDAILCAAERVRWLEAVTDAGLAHLTVDRLLDELLDKVRELMAVDTVAVLLLVSK